MQDMMSTCRDMACVDNDVDITPVDDSLKCLQNTFFEWKILFLKVENTFLCFSKLAALIVKGKMILMIICRKCINSPYFARRNV